VRKKKTLQKNINTIKKFIDITTGKNKIISKSKIIKEREIK